MSNSTENTTRRRKPWWHYLFGCVWQEDRRGFHRRCVCGRHQTLMSDGDWPSYWEDDRVE